MKINGNQKGKRVEREVAAWLKENGIASARRTEQYSGSPEGLSDVTAKELPSWHIESKGHATAKITRSVLKSWVDQVERDCPADKLPVIISLANGQDKVAILTFKTHDALKSVIGIPLEYIAVIDKSINPSLCFKNFKEHDGVFNFLRNIKPKPISSYSLVYKVCEDPYTICIIVEGLTWLEYAKNYEARIKPVENQLLKDLSNDITNAETGARALQTSLPKLRPG